MLCAIRYNNFMPKETFSTSLAAIPAGLLAGDAAAALVITLIGFATHQSSLTDFRWLTTFVPLCLAWLMIAPWLGVYRAEVYRSPRQLWRPALAMFLAGPWAALLRALMLNAAVLPIFALVLAASGAAGMLVWRFVYLGLTRGGRHG